MEGLVEGLKHFGFDTTEKQQNQFEKYAELLLSWNEKMNLTAITEIKEIAEKHFADSVSCAPLIKNGSEVIDVGSGAGFPGLPVKIVREDIKITLLDSLNKRLNFLEEVIKELGLSNIKTVHARAEDGARDKSHREKYDVVLSRAVAPLPGLCEYCLPYVKKGGVMIALKGREAENEAGQAEKAIKVLGGELLEIKDAFYKDMEHKIIVIKKTANTPSQYPRKAGKPSKQPIV